MWFIEIILDILSYPIHWFWDRVETLNNQGQKGKIVLLFAVSLSGVGLLCLVLLWVGNYLITYHPTILVSIGLIFWLYAWVKSKHSKNSLETNNSVATSMSNLDFQYQKAQHRLPLLDDVIFTCSKIVASHIDCYEPSDVAEIYDSSSRLEDDGRFVYGVYRLEKKDFLETLTEEKLKEHQTRIQHKLNHLVSSNKFQLRKLPTESDYFGETLYGVKVCSVYDQGQYLVFWVLFDTPEYRDYASKHGTYTTIQIGETLHDASWDEFDC